jgi:hypothetical protein
MQLRKDGEPEGTSAQTMEILRMQGKDQAGKEEEE